MNASCGDWQEGYKKVGIFYENRVPGPTARGQYERHVIMNPLRTFKKNPVDPQSTDQIVRPEQFHGPARDSRSGSHRRGWMLNES